MLNSMAIIDIGTNTILYRQVNHHDDGTIQHGHQEMRCVRLGTQVDKVGLIQEGPMDHAIDTINDYANLARENHIDHIVAVGTRVFRSAKNCDNICRTIQQKTGLTIEILTPEDEAKWSYRGAVYGRKIEGSVTVLDIGGGSTEISLGKGNDLQKTMSITMGSVVLTERFFAHDPPLRNELKEMESTIKSYLTARDINLWASSERLIGVGGTVTTLAAVACGMNDYDPDRIDGLNMTMSTIEGLFNQMKQLTLPERKRMIRPDPQRADIILAGILILKTIMTFVKCHEIMVSDRGLRFGIALREVVKIRNHLKYI